MPGGTAKARSADAVGPTAVVPACDGLLSARTGGGAAMPSRSCDLATTDLDNSPELLWAGPAVAPAATRHKAPIPAASVLE
jgi:hypothetical protein